MAIEQKIGQESGPKHCPIDHGVGAWQYASEHTASTPAVSRGEDGTWHIRDHALVRQVLRSASTTQAGFGAEQIARIPGTLKRPILYLDGKAHQEQRKQAARFFTPKAVSGRYRDLMVRHADDLIIQLKREKHADLAMLTGRLAVAIIADVVGLTDSVMPGLGRRLEAFFDQRDHEKNRIRASIAQARNFIRKLAFLLLDLQPAIRRRRRQPQEDVISHLLSRNYKNIEILIECVSYGAAGMATTREFITVAAMYLLADPELREQYLGAPERERHLLLEEILRVEPVIGHLYRQTHEEIVLTNEEASTTIPAGSRLDLHVRAANFDERVTGPDPEAVCPGRALTDKQSPPSMMSFGDGYHRCPGAYIAIQEADIFLRRLVALPSLRLEQQPTVTWDSLTSSYVLRGCMISV